MKNGKPGFRTTSRDYEILRNVGRCGALTAEQIGWFHFGWCVFCPTEKLIDSQTGQEQKVRFPPKLAVHSNCQRRMKLLHKGGFVQRVQRYQLLADGKLPYFYSLTPFGAESLAEYLGCSLEELEWRRTDSRLRPNYVEHLIATNDVRLAIMKSCDAVGMTLLEWRDELQLAKDHSELRLNLANDNTQPHYGTFIPDAYIILQEKDGTWWNFFLEIDRGTEVITSNNESYRTWERKMRTYKRFFAAENGQKSLYEQAYGTTKGRMLAVTKGSQRLAHLMAVTRQIGASNRFWFTVHDSVIEPRIFNRKAVMPNLLLDPIWDFIGNPDDELRTLFR